MGENEELNTGVIETPEPSEVVETPSTPEPEPEKPDAEEEKRKQIAEHAFKRREAERKAHELEKQVEELRRKTTQQDRPTVPELADPLTLNEQQWAEQIRQRDEAIRRAAEWDAQQRLSQDQQRQLEAERQRQQQEALQRSAKEYTERAVKLGMKPEELQQAGNLVGRFGLSGELVQMILDDDQGPLITKYLAQNVDELDHIVNLNPFQAAVHIATTVKQKAAALKPKVSTAPSPTTSVRGAGIVADGYGPKGATYE